MVVCEDSISRVEMMYFVVGCAVTNLLLLSGTYRRVGVIRPILIHEIASD